MKSESLVIADQHAAVNTFEVQIDHILYAVLHLPPCAKVKADMSTLLIISDIADEPRLFIPEFDALTQPAPSAEHGGDGAVPIHVSGEDGKVHVNHGEDDEAPHADQVHQAHVRNRVRYL